MVEMVGLVEMVGMVGMVEIVEMVGTVEAFVISWTCFYGNVSRS